MDITRHSGRNCLSDCEINMTGFDCVTVVVGRFWTFRYQGLCKFVLIYGYFQTIEFWKTISSFFTLRQ